MSDSNSQNTQTVQPSIAETTPNHRHLAWFLHELRSHDKSAHDTIPDRTKEQYLKKLLEDKEFYDAVLSSWYKFGRKIRLIGLAKAFNVPSVLPRAIFTSGAWAFAVHNLLTKASNALVHIVRQGHVGGQSLVELTSQLSKLEVAWNSTKEVLSRWPETSLVFDEKVQGEVEIWFRERPASAALVAIPAVGKKPQLTLIDGLSDAECAMRLEIEQALTSAGLPEDGLTNIVNAVFRSDGSTVQEKLTKKAIGFRFRAVEARSEDLLELSYILAKAAGLAANEFDFKFEQMNASRLQREAKVKRAKEMKQRQIRNEPVRPEAASDEEPTHHVDIAELEAAIQRSRKIIRRKNRK